jgi:glutathione-specific gamma-glutamylcyclotransferase
MTELTLEPCTPELPPPAARRDPEPLLAMACAQWGGQNDLWVFGYASLIWRPEFAADEHRKAWVHGYHRALRMRSRLNRGTPDRPGLVFALMAGGSCRGMVYRIDRCRAADELERLWAREMPGGVYDPKWLPCRTPAGPVTALAFTLSPRSPNFTGRLHDEDLVDVLRHARGRFGTTLDYVVATAHALRQHGMPDREVERLVTLARHHRLL